MIIVILNYDNEKNGTKMMMLETHCESQAFELFVLIQAH